MQELKNVRNTVEKELVRDSNSANVNLHEKISKKADFQNPPFLQAIFEEIMFLYKYSVENVA